MPRVIWKGTLSFGLVEIPVGLYSAENKTDEISFSMLDRRDLAPIGYERINKRTGEKVPWEEIVKGYEHEKGEYVVVTEEEIENANAEVTQTIDIVGFVEADAVETVFYDKPYYLEPTKKNSKSYALLRETLVRSGKIGIAKVVIRTRQRIAALVVRGPLIVLDLLRYAHELRDVDEFKAPEGDLAALGLSDREIAMGEALIEGMTMEWSPGEYRDEYRDDVLALVERKVAAGKSAHVDAEEQRPRKVRTGEVLDLMPLLKQSVEQHAARPGKEKLRVAAASAPRKKRATAKKPAAKRKQA
jgi:DNA end-binding protein Ku